MSVLPDNAPKHMLETLDFCARTELKAHALGPINTLTEAQLLPFDAQHNLLPEFAPLLPLASDAISKKRLL